MSPGEDQTPVDLVVVGPDHPVLSQLTDVIDERSLGMVRRAALEESWVLAERFSAGAVLLLPGVADVAHLEALAASKRFVETVVPLVALTDSGVQAGPLLTAGATLVVPVEEPAPLQRARIRALLDFVDRTRLVVAGHESRLADQAWSLEQLEYLVHDLKGPLAGIIAIIHVVARNVTDETWRKLLSDGMNAARHLERMILNVLDVGRLEAGALKLDAIDVSLDDLVDEALAAVRPLATARRVELQTRLGDRAERVVRLDFDLVTRLLTNLLDNAIRHSPSGGIVRVVADGTEGEGIELAVEDEGPGVPEAWRGRIFERFVRRNESGPGRLGRGLGLAFAKQVADAHGFELGVIPRDPDGSRFFLRLPGQGRLG